MIERRKPLRKNKEIRFRGSSLDVARLVKLAAIHEVTPSALLRRLIAEECARRGVEVK